MKKIILIGFAGLVLSACNSADSTASDQRADSLISVINERDSSLHSFISSFNEIETNLDSVASKQKIIVLYTDKLDGELKDFKKIHINAEIAAINVLMEKNRNELENLNKKLKSSKTKNALLEKTIATLTIQISQKDYELCELNLKMDALKTRVSKLVTVIDSLGEQNYIKSIVIDYQTTDLNAVYYLVGEEKDLIDQKIIDRKGGLLGMGKTSTLNANFDNTLFTYIDLTKTTQIPIAGKSVKIITNHPSESYLLEEDLTQKGLVKNLVIINPVKFWNASRYLVIVKK